MRRLWVCALQYLQYITILKLSAECQINAQILYGNIAPEGCVGKITGKEGMVFEGPARVFDSEEDMLASLSENPQALKVG
jgi:dihydroxy-acid dehydratase